MADNIEKQDAQRNRKFTADTRKQKSQKKNKKDKGEKQLPTSTSPKPELGPIGIILFMLLLVFAIVLDILPFVTAGFSSLLDWILDLGFFAAVSISLMIISGDMFDSLIGRRAMVNIIQTILEFIPLIDFLPWHLLALAIIFLDFKYNILNFAKRFQTSSNPSK